MKNMGQQIFIWRLLGWGLLALAARAAVAEQGAGQAPVSVRGAGGPEARFEFRVFDVARKGPVGVYFRNAEGKMRELVFNRRRRSRVYSYRGPPKMEFFRKTGVDDAGKPEWDTVAVLRADPEVREKLIFFLPGAMGKSGRPGEGRSFRLRWIDDSPENFPGGSLVVFNACGAPLAGRLGDRDFHLGFGSSAPMDLGKLRHGRGDWVSARFAVRVGEDYELVYGNKLSFTEGNRVILVLRPPRRSGSLRIDTYLIEDSPGE